MLFKRFVVLSSTKSTCVSVVGRSQRKSQGTWGPGDHLLWHSVSPMGLGDQATISYDPDIIHCLYSVSCTRYNLMIILSGAAGGAYLRDIFRYNSLNNNSNFKYIICSLFLCCKSGRTIKPVLVLNWCHRLILP